MYDIDRGEVETKVVMVGAVTSRLTAAVVIALWCSTVSRVAAANNRAIVVDFTPLYGKPYKGSPLSAVTSADYPSVHYIVVLGTLVCIGCFLCWRYYCGEVCPDCVDFIGETPHDDQLLSLYSSRHYEQQRKISKGFMFGPGGNKVRSAR